MLKRGPEPKHSTMPRNQDSEALQSIDITSQALSLSAIVPGLRVPRVGGALGSFSATSAQLLLTAIPSWP